MERVISSTSKLKQKSDAQFDLQFFEASHFGIMITDLFANIIRVNDAAKSRVFRNNIPANILGSLASENDIDLIALKKGYALSHQSMFELVTPTIKYTLYNIRQPDPQVYVWMIPLPANETDHCPDTVDNHQRLAETTFELIFRSTKEGYINFHNKLFERTFGYTRDEIRSLGTNSLFIHPEAYANLLQVIRQQGHCEDTTVHLRKKDGGIIIGKLNAQMDESVSGSLVTWTVLDVTRNHEYELSLMQKNEDLAKINAQMEKFLYSTSHDLRSPLTTVLGLVNLLRIERQNEDALNYVDKIEECIIRLDDIIKDIMRFSKNSYQRLQSEKIYMEPLISKIINSLSHLPGYKRINFEIAVTENETFFSDHERLEIIINNIVRNAILFSDANKSKPFVAIKVKAVNDEAVIDVIDNGIGIGKSHLSNIFNMFYRATDRSKGAGLGLYVAKEAADRLKGSITVDSEIGFGTAFKIRIPYDHKGRLITRKHHLQHGVH